MSDGDETPKLAPEAPGFREAEAFQIGIEADGGITINLIDYFGDAPLRIAQVHLTPAEADELGRFLTQRREARAYAENQKGKPPH